jgi:hypothetical protein
MIERENKMFKERVAEKDKRLMEANRLASIQLRTEFSENENAWWNRLAEIDLPELKLMPLGFVKKYNSYINNIYKYEGDAKL